jgi:hypothetical protein
MKVTLQHKDRSGHSVSSVITANKGKDNAYANKTKQIEPLGDT